MKASVNNITIEYESFGNESDPSLVLIAGLGSQLITWEQEFIDEFVNAGLRVVIFDNRDVGKSTWFDEFGKADYSKALLGSAPYLLSDMADDVAALLKDLHIEQAHIFGVSLGGMIAQEIAIRHANTVITLTSIMSMTGAPNVGQASEQAAKQLFNPSPVGRDAYLQSAWERFQITGASSKFPVSEENIKQRAARAYDRAFHPEGSGRQIAAMLASGDRTNALHLVKVPTLVIHGTEDALVNFDGGIATAEAIPDAELVLIDGMGHHLPKDAWPLVIEPSLRVIARA
jgi:pimeloyl-ACP methyl ester carboxylesterase